LVVSCTSTCGCGAGGEGLVEEQVTVRGFALERDEQVAGADFAGIEGHARNLEQAVGCSAYRLGNLLRCPERAHCPPSLSTERVRGWVSARRRGLALCARTHPSIPSLEREGR
jgi:hypothetical protein